MAVLHRRVTRRLLQQLFTLIVFLVVVSISPLLVTFYVLCWIRAKLTARLYSITGHALMMAYDTLAGLEFNSNNTIVNNIIIVNKHLPVEDVKNSIFIKIIDAKDSKNKPLFPKVARCMTIRAGYFMWHEKGSFNIDDHVRPFLCQPPRDEDELKLVINDLCNVHLNPSKPRWEIVVIPIAYKQKDDPQTVLLGRMHHCIGDGISLARMLLEVCGGVPQYIPVRTDLNHASAAWLGHLKQIMYTIVASPAIIYELIFSKEQYHRHHTKLSGKYIFDWTSTIKMSTIKNIKNATSTTVNDVMVSCLAGACRKYLLKQGVHPPDFLKSMMPIAFHHPDDPIELKNESLSVLHRLPTGDMDCVQRLKATKSIMDELKRSPDIFITRWFLKHCVNTVPYSIMKWLYDTARFNVIFSNVPGPTNNVLFNGHVIDSCFTLAQTRSPSHFGVIAVSYAGNLTVGLTVDTAVISTKEEARLVLNDFVQEVLTLYDSVIYQSV